MLKDCWNLWSFCPLSLRQVMLIKTLVCDSPLIERTEYCRSKLKQLWLQSVKEQCSTRQRFMLGASKRMSAMQTFRYRVLASSKRCAVNCFEAVHWPLYSGWSAIQLSLPCQSAFLASIDTCIFSLVTIGLHAFRAASPCYNSAS
jgi:hypothetical protein